ncbi:hypothetical protein ACET3Z_004538 [Daucus carota]
MPLQVCLLLKALGAPKDVRIFWDEGTPFGEKEALLSLTKEFSHFYNKNDLDVSFEYLTKLLISCHLLELLSLILIWVSRKFATKAAPPKEKKNKICIIIKVEGERFSLNRGDYKINVQSHNGIFLTMESAILDN